MRYLTDNEISLIKDIPLDHDFICRSKKSVESISYIHDLKIFSYFCIESKTYTQFIYDLRDFLCFDKDFIYANKANSNLLINLKKFSTSYPIKRNYSEEFQQDLIDYGITHAFHLVLNPTENLKNAIKLNNL